MKARRTHVTQTNDRLEQFKKMAADDPTNELGHFSLGRAYLEAGMAADAAGALARALEINPNISKAYQLLADAQIQLGKKDDAIETLRKGAMVAHQRGDMMPKNAMVAKLKEFGVEMPELTGGGGAAQAVVSEGQVLCKRCGKVGPKLAKPPFRSEFGQEIYDKICGLCWKEAIAMGTKVINELRLPLADPQAQKMWDQHIREFLGL
jgi:Fe-S cluster biosynthesis and repair protein YggX